MFPRVPEAFTRDCETAHAIRIGDVVAGLSRAAIGRRGEEIYGRGADRAGSGPCVARSPPVMRPKQDSFCERPGLDVQGVTFEMVPPIVRASCEGGWSDEGVGVAGPLRQRSPTTIAREPDWHLPRSGERRDSCFGSRRSPVEIRAPRLAEGSCKTAVWAVALAPPRRSPRTVLGCTRGAPAFQRAPRDA